MSIHKLKLFIILLLITFSTLYAKTLRIMPLGDSITYGNNKIDEAGNKPRHVSQRYTYRGPLWKKLKDAKIDFDFVGSKKSGEDYAKGFDPDNEGYPGESSLEISERIYQLLKIYRPNTILLHIGSNDESSSMDGINEILEIIDAYEGSSSREVYVIVALIIDTNPSKSRIKKFNSNLENLIKHRWEKGDKLTLVNMYTGAGLSKNDYVDGIHLNDKGYTKMANVWYKALTSTYKAYSEAPIAKNDNIEAVTGEKVTINVLENDIDYQNDIDKSSITFENNTTILEIAGEGKWHADKTGYITFTPNKLFTADPTPLTYTIKDTKGHSSKPATIKINYSNASLENYPTSIVNKVYIESISIDEASNSVTFITRVPNNGIHF